jgi:epsilon-lactone hydrolase
LSLLVSLRDEGRPLPAAAVLISPWLDLTQSGDSYQTRCDVDPSVQARSLAPLVKHYLADGTARHPLASPLFAKLDGLPPLLIQVGDHEVLLDDSVRLANQAKVAGVEAQLEIWREMYHVWHLWAPSAPESADALRSIGKYVKRRLKVDERI